LIVLAVLGICILSQPLSQRGITKSS
jgi:hypothetical protein